MPENLPSAPERLWPSLTKVGWSICDHSVVFRDPSLPTFVHANSAARLRRSILPIAFLGIAETIRITLGTLKSARRARQACVLQDRNYQPGEEKSDCPYHENPRNQ